MLFTSCGCNCEEPNPTPGLDSRTLATWRVRAQEGGALGPHLGGGVSSAGLNEACTLPVAGGGFAPAMTHAAVDVVSYPQLRRDFHWDWSTPDKLGFSPPPAANQALKRQFGGLV